jgi:hypothetical protein
MSKKRLIAVPCRISQGIVSNERAFELDLHAGGTYTGGALRFYFWNDQDQPLTADEPGGGQEIEGKIAARLLRHENRCAVIAIPDGQVVLVDSQLVAPRPTEVKFDVSVGP